MKIILSKENNIETAEMRHAYVDTIIEMIDAGQPVMHLDADLMYASGVRGKWKEYPKNIIECGIAESNMLGTAAGLSSEGKIPFTHSFGAFSARRVCDQIFMSCAYAKLNVKVIGSDPGVCAELNGGTHAANEDISIMRAIPEVTIIEPTDVTMLKQLIKSTVDTYGVFYIRLLRRFTKKVYEEGSTFELGKAALIRDGKDVTIVAAGIEVAEAIEAAKILEAEGISARVLDMFTIKPLDTEAIIAAAQETGAIVTAENHNIVGGLGAAVAETLVENCPVPMERIGINDIFGEVGKMDYLMKRFELTAEDIVKKAKKVIARK